MTDINRQLTLVNISKNESPIKITRSAIGVNIERATTGTVVTACSGGGAAIWGGITGTLSDQTDLQNALNAKLNTSDFNLSTFNTDDLAESATNKYWTSARIAAALAPYVLATSLATVATTGAYADLSGKPTLGTAAAQDIGYFATAAQGAKADTALQPNDNISELVNDVGYITSYTETDTLASVTGRGASTAVESTFSGGLLSPHLKATTSGGGSLKTNSGDNALIWGSGGSANGTLYGGWNYDNATANTIAYFGASKTLSSLSTATYPSLTEISYVKGVTSGIQTQIDGKQATLVSGTNIKTINSTSLLGSGNIAISASPAGSDTQIQYNNAGSFGASSNLTWDNTAGSLNILHQYNSNDNALFIRDNRVGSPSSEAEVDHFKVRTQQNYCEMTLRTSQYDTNASTAVNFYKGSGIGTNYTNWFSGTNRLLLMGIGNDNRPRLEAGSGTIFTFAVGNSSGFVVTTGASAYITMQAGSIAGSGSLTLYGTSATTGNNAGILCPNGDVGYLVAGSSNIAQFTSNGIFCLAGFTPQTYVDDDAPDECLYISDDSGKLSWKDGDGTVNDLSGTNTGDQTITSAHGFTVDGGGSAISTGKTAGYYTHPTAANLVGWNISVDTGTATVKVWKVAAGTAVPTIADVINTSGVSISTGTHVSSSTMTDFTTTSVAAGDIFAFDITAISGATEITFELIFEEV